MSDILMFPGEPGYWMNETGPELRPAVEAYLHSQRLTARQVELLKLYLVQWIMTPIWEGAAEIDELRSLAIRITNQEEIDHWLLLAEKSGIDPL